MKRTPIEGCILLSALCVCWCGLDVRQRITSVYASEECVIKKIFAQDDSGGITVFTRGLVVYLLDELRSLREAAH